MKLRFRFSGLFLAIFIFANCSSGTQQFIVETPPKVLVSGYSETEQIPLRVELFLSDGLRAAEWHGKGLGDSGIHRLALGEVLAHNAENITREVFAAVVVTGGSGGPGQAGLPAVLIPRFVNAEKYGDTLTVLLEWILKDSEGNIVWADTIKGEGTSSWSLWTLVEPASTAMLTDLFHRSFTVMSSSRAIREFAARQRRQSSLKP